MNVPEPNNQHQHHIVFVHEMCQRRTRQPPTSKPRTISVRLKEIGNNCRSIKIVPIVEPMGEVVMTFGRFVICMIVLSFIFSLPAAAAKPIVQLEGVDLQGGAAELFGSIMAGEIDVNYVYAVPTGSRSAMSASFKVTDIPKDPLFVYIKGRDDEPAKKCEIAIEINHKKVFSGPSEFPNAEWEIRSYPVPAGALVVGENIIQVTSLEKEGRVGMPPWFQVAKLAIAPKDYTFKHNISKDFFINLPTQINEFPEPYTSDRQAGFAIRGTKGWMWTPEQYLSEIPVMAKCKMNFLMNCYGSMCDIEHYAWGNPEVNRWWEDLPASKKAAYEKIVRECDKNGIAFCFSMNPNLCSKRALQYSSAEDIDMLWKHYAWMQGLGVKWFNISLDDISQGIDASGQAKVVNEIYKRLKANDPSAKMIFTPTAYWGDGTDAKDRSYLEILANELDADIYLFWTGDSVVGNINRSAAVSYKNISKHRLFLWDNYPVNDDFPTMHLGPIINRDPDLYKVIDGYMCNPLCKQNQANRIPMLTCADYAYNPEGYDPLRSIGQAILHLEDTQEKREIIKELVEVYPGFIILGKPNTGLNPVRENFAKIVSLHHGRPIVEGYMLYLEGLSARLDKAFPDKYKAARKALADDIIQVRQMIKERYGP